MKYIIETCIVGAVIAIFGFYLNQDNFDVRYTLSERIPLSFGSGADETVQQLEISNLSKKEISKIQVKIPTKILQYEIIKNSQDDKVAVYKDAKPFEVLYPSLPSKATFRIIIKTAGVGISKNEIIVRHDKGIAEEALTGSQSASWDVLFYSLTIIFYLWIIYSLIRAMIASNWQDRIKYHSEELIVKSKPFYFTVKKWEEIRNEILRSFGREYSYGMLELSAINNSPIFKYLNSNQPEHLSSAEWNHFKYKKSTEMLDDINFKLAARYSKTTSDILHLLELQRPNNFPVDIWEKWQTNLQKNVIALFELENIYYEDILKTLSRPKPASIPDEVWQKFHIILVKKCTAYLTDHLVSGISRDYINFIKDKDKLRLSAAQLEPLVKLAYRLQLNELPDLTINESAQKFIQNEKPEWMTLTDYERKKALAERIVTANNNEREYTMLCAALNTILSGFPLDEENISPLAVDQRNKLKKLDEKIRQESDRNIADRRQLTIDLTELTKSQKIIRSQLKIINDVFLDPSSIDRIEPYDNPFAIGNFENLRKLAEKMNGI